MVDSIKKQEQKQMMAVKKNLFFFSDIVSAITSYSSTAHDEMSGTASPPISPKKLKRR